MITNEKQFRSTRLLIDRLRAGLTALDASSDVHPMFMEAQRSALTSQIEELKEDVALYEALRSGQIRTFDAEGLHDLPDILIRARIARGMSQKDLADFLGLKEQQIQRCCPSRLRIVEAKAGFRPLTATFEEFRLAAPLAILAAGPGQARMHL